MKIQADFQNIALHENSGGISKYWRFMKIQAEIQNLGACSKLRRMSKIWAEKLCGIVKFMRHIIYARTKADVEISASDEN